MDLINISSLVTLQPITLGVIIAGVIAFLLLFVSGFASGSEIAFFSLSPKDINELEPDKSRSDYHIQLQKKKKKMVRESFWNVYRPGCLEHYLLNQLRFSYAMN